MRILFNSRSMRMPVLLLATTFFFAACGGGGGADTTVAPPAPQATTGTIGILLTDAPTDDLSAINLSVTEVVLIGDMGQQLVFSGNVTIDLLDLANYAQPIAFGEVVAGSYNKIRLRIENVELVDKATETSTFLSLPANGKIDLLDRGGFTVFPGRTLLAEIDMDANKSIHIVGTGSGTYKFRPVVKVKIMDGGLPAKLVRLEGVVAEIFDEPAGRFRLCHEEDPSSCIVVNLAEGGSVFDAEGLPTSIGELMIGDPVIVIGAFRHENDDDGDSDSDSDADSDSDSDSDSDGDHADVDLELDAIVIEIGGNAEQFRGVVASAPDENGEFQFVVGKETATVLIQDGTKVFGADGELGVDAIVVGAIIVVEGVVVKPANPDQVAGINSALIFVGDVVDDEMLTGKIVEPLDAVNLSFNLATASGDFCVQLLEEAKITIVSKGADGQPISEKGEFSDLAPGQPAEVFGHAGVGGCFQTSEVVVDLTG